MDPNRLGWERLQNLLERLKPGDTIHVRDAAAETGLAHATCAMVLEALARVELFTPQGDGTFLRRRLLEKVEKQP
jgi:hypothetical protein